MSTEGAGVNSNFHKNTGFIMIAQAIHSQKAANIPSIVIYHPQMCTCYSDPDSNKR